MKNWKIWAAALAIGAALIAAPAAQALTVKPKTTATAHKVVAKKVTPQVNKAAVKKTTVSKTTKKVVTKTAPKKGTAAAKGTKKPSTSKVQAGKWHHPQLHGKA